MSRPTLRESGISGARLGQNALIAATLADFLALASMIALIELLMIAVMELLVNGQKGVSETQSNLRFSLLFTALILMFLELSILGFLVWAVEPEKSFLPRGLCKRMAKAINGLSGPWWILW